MVITRIGPLSCARVCGTLYAILGFIFGGIFSLAAFAGSLASNSSRVGVLRAFMGVGAIVFFPIMYGALGFVFSLLSAWLYNGIAGRVGGIEMEVH
jgi:hypothetical protein